MAYVAVKGGERAIDAAHAWLAAARRGDTAVPLLDPAQIAEQLGRAVDRVMAEGSLHDRELAALAIQQAQGDLIEAAFLLRAYRTTLPRFGHSEPVDTAAMLALRRISAIFKDLPGGQVLGPTYDYTHRLLDFGQADAPPPPQEVDAEPAAVPPAFGILGREDLVEPDPPRDEAAPGDITRDPLAFPAPRDVRLQSLARGDEGFLLAMGYSTQRGWGGTHPFVGELRVGEAEVVLTPPELGFPISIGDVMLTECQMVNQFAGSKTGAAAIHPRLRPLLRPERAPGDGHVAGGPRDARRGAGRGRRPRRRRTSNSCCIIATTSRRPASSSTSSCRTTWTSRANWRRSGRCAREATLAGGRGMSAGYNFAYLDEQTKRMIRRAILKGVAIPGHQVPFGSREMPLPYGWGTGGIQVTASILGRVRRAEGHRPRRRRHDQRRQHPPLLRPHRRRRDHDADRGRHRHPDPAPHPRDAAPRGPDHRLPGADAGADVPPRAQPGRDAAHARRSPNTG